MYHEENTEDAYLKSLRSMAHGLEKSFHWWVLYYQSNNKEYIISKALAHRLRVYYTTQKSVNDFLNKGIIGAGADFFVESVLFFLKVYLASTQSSLQVVSEKILGTVLVQDSAGKWRNKAVRPDISLYDGDKVVAVIECKTQLGRARDSWEQSHSNRKQEVAQLFPNAKTFLLVMTEQNWSGFGMHLLLGEEYFCLLKDWPIGYEETSDFEFITPIEKLFSKLI